MSTEQALNTFVKDTGGWVASQLEACTRCGMCAEACHFYQATEKPEYSPVWKFEPLRRAYEQRFTFAGRLKLALGLDRTISNEDLAAWSEIDFTACTLCNRCSMVCPMGIDSGSDHPRRTVRRCGGWHGAGRSGRCHTKAARRRQPAGRRRRCLGSPHRVGIRRLGSGAFRLM